MSFSLLSSSHTITLLLSHCNLNSLPSPYVHFCLSFALSLWWHNFVFSFSIPALLVPAPPDRMAHTYLTTWIISTSLPIPRTTCLHSFTHLSFSLSPSFIHSKKKKKNQKQGRDVMFRPTDFHCLTINCPTNPHTLHLSTTHLISYITHHHPLLLFHNMFTDSMTSHLVYQLQQ